MHLNGTCQYVEIICPESGCEQRFMKKDSASHKCSGIDGRSEGAKGETEAENSGCALKEVRIFTGL